MRRVILIVMDGCGIGAMPDAAHYGKEDSSSATIPHVAQSVGGLNLPALERLGLGLTSDISGVSSSIQPSGGWGRSAVLSEGKDTVTGHWEMMGIITTHPAPTYPNGFPSHVIQDFEFVIGRGTLGNVPASGTDILKKLGEEHIKTGFPIVYTSADSVFQLAAHESVIPLPELYNMCSAARALLTGDNNVQRVIARPFTGTGPDSFSRTENRRDYPIVPPDHNLLRTLVTERRTAHAIGVVAELFPTYLFARAERTQNNPAHLTAIKNAVHLGHDSLIFANCEDFDMLYGHRNDPIGFAKSLSLFDTQLSDITGRMRSDDLLILTADHGNDPTTSSTDHSREYVPVLLHGAKVPPNTPLGTRATLADIAATIARWLEIPWKGPGTAMEIF